jgi:hypothetical protein
MNFKSAVITVGCLMLVACAAPVPPAPTTQVPSPEQQVQDQINAMAAPNQNIQTARLRTDDNCYWFSYVGPVETTELPLLTTEGRHICAPKPAVVEVKTEAAA